MSAPEPEESLNVPIGSERSASVPDSQIAGQRLEHSDQSNPQSSSASPEEHGTWKEKLDDLLSGPPTARLISGTLFVIVALAVCVSQFYDLWQKWHEHAPASVDYTHETGNHLTGKDDPEGAQSTAKETAQMSHLEHHLLLTDCKKLPIPPEVLVAAGAESDALTMQFYTSDGCIFVHRHHQGFEKDDWLQDLADKAEKRKSNASIEAPQPGSAAALAIMRDSDFPAEPPPKLIRVQTGGRCLNPHPGQFNWWWVPPKVAGFPCTDNSQTAACIIRCSIAVGSIGMQALRGTGAFIS
jgi:hypothetical protein